ncbi:MAG TPA: TetR/AcrR family transcriptional regulator [Solirubrobacteraceae bacterium]|jgi:AcrR family transcriptional regulator|nr:TetR/AcrR family transcriptional regulator [Solirubrobacteraceae bacterium]
MPRGHFDRSARKAQTRAALLEAAADVYARRGFAGATLEEVAAEAGFTKGAVYAHFGSKENLLLALMEEHLAGQVVEQLQLFDRERVTWERPLAGSDSWMENVSDNPERFRLFVELWVYAQRDEGLRTRLAAALEHLRATFAGFAAASAADAGLESPPEAAEQCANVMMGLGLGLGMLKLTDSGSVPPMLLGATISVLIRAMESSPEARELIAGLAAARRNDADRPAAAGGRDFGAGGGTVAGRVLPLSRPR